MNKGKMIRWSVEGAALVALILGVNGLLAWQKGQLAAPRNLDPEVQAYPPPEVQTPPPTSQAAPTRPPKPTKTPFPQVDWSPLPLCVNQPLALVEWRDEAAKLKSDDRVRRKLEAYLRQAQPLSATLREVKPEDLETILAASDGAPAAQVARRELVVLWLNVISGRLNLATELAIPDREAMDSVEKLTAELETAVTSGKTEDIPLEASRDLQAGKGIARHVCARLLYLQAGNKIQEVRWTGRKMESRIVFERPASPDFPVSMGRISVSPNLKLLAIGTQGPMYLLDIPSGKLVNLFDSIKPSAEARQVKLDETEHWEVIGWTPDSQRLLIAPGTLQSVAWIDLLTYTYTFIPIRGIGNSDEVDLGPNGSGFVTISRSDDIETLEFYNLSLGQFTTLFSIQTKEGHLYYPRYSPNGELIAYQIHRPSTSQEHSTSLVTLRVFNPESKAQVKLYEGKLTRMGPNWSPDGEWIAFYQQETGDKFFSGTSLGRFYFGNIWIVSVLTGETRQITNVEGAVFHPVWSPGGVLFSFLTHNGEIGVASIEQANASFLVVPTSLRSPPLISYTFLP